MPLATIHTPEFPTLHLGPVQIQSFGVLTALGVMTAVLLAARAARLMGKDPQVVMDFSVVGILTGVVTGHLVHVFGYHPEELEWSWRVLKFWEGLSSMGGLVGGILAAVLWFRWKRIDFRQYADAFALGLAPGWGIARVGCFTVHDHPGLRTDFFLGVWMDAAGRPGPGAVARHDLGLYEAILLFSLGALLWILYRRGALRGRLLPLLAVLYGTARFFLDFLRARPGATDANGNPVYVDGRIFWGTLTPAQVIVACLVVYGVWRLVTTRAAAAQPGKDQAA